MTKITIEKAKKEVTLYGISHDSLKQIKYLKKELISISPQLIFVEGNFNLVIFNNEKEAITCGEMGFISYYCKKNNIKVMSNDPINKECYEMVSNKYDKKIAYLYFALRDYSTNHTHPRVNFEKLSNYYHEFFKKPIKAHRDYTNHFDPTKNLSLLNEITRVLNKFRDNFMLKELKKALKYKDKIVIVKGDYHIKSMAKEIFNLVINEG